MLNGTANFKTAYRFNSFAHIKKIWAFFACFIIAFAFFNIGGEFLNKMTVYAEPSQDIEQDLEESTGSVLDGIDFDELEEIIYELELDNLFNGKSFKEYVSAVLSGEEVFDISSFFSLILSLLKSSLKNALSPVLLILVITLLCSLLSSLRSEKISGVGEIINLICFAVIIIILALLSKNLIVSAKNSLELMQRQMNALFPILLVLMTGMGAAVSASAYTPLVAVLSNLISNVFCYVLLPLFTLSLILAFVGHISDNAKLGKLNGFIKSTFKWIIGTVFAVFMGYLSIKGFTAGAADGISIKATKYAIKNYIPMLGGYISEGFELAKASSMLVKNAVGFVGILVLAITIISPVILLAVTELSLKLVSGIVEPMGNKKAASLLSSVAGSLKLLVVIVIGVALMYFLTIYLMTCSVANIF